MIGKTNAISGVSAPVPKIKTVSGSVISISDALALSAESLVVDINAVQSGSGDPSPSNVRPISGWDAVNVWRTGKNLIDDSIKEISGSNLYVGNLHAYTIPLKAGTYTFSVQFASGVHYSASIREKNDSGNTALWSATSTTTEKTFTLPQDGLYRLWMAPRSGETVATTGVVHAQIELGSTATAYEPYNGNAYTIQLGQTVYGGSLDVTTGELTVTHGYLNLNTASMNNGENYPGWKSSGVRAMVGANINSKITGAIINVGTVVQANTTGNNDTLFLPKNTYNKTQTEWQALALDCQFVIPLATPQTVQLTATEVQMLLGNNTIWSDSGDSTLQYWARR